ncbi:MAG: hypothetical protein LBM27_04245, partial [Lactobacillaceae bacterium]|nr:hypothetical protein [Lactobacillaceae bacterium]
MQRPVQANPNNVYRGSQSANQNVAQLQYNQYRPANTSQNSNFSRPQNNLGPARKISPQRRKKVKKNGFSFKGFKLPKVVWFFLGVAGLVVALLT